MKITNECDIHCIHVFLMESIFAKVTKFPLGLFDFYTESFLSNKCETVENYEYNQISIRWTKARTVKIAMNGHFQIELRDFVLFNEPCLNRGC